MGLLDGKNVVLTGGASGIGLATATLFVAEGARVHVLDLPGAKLDAVASIVEPTGGSTNACDVTVRDQVDAAIAVATAGNKKIDVVIANAGISSPAAPFEEYPLDGFEHVLKVHVVGAFHTIQACLPHVPDGASIIITSSVAGLVGTPQVSAYGTAKHAQIGLMRSLAADLAERGIRVNTINPGPVDNEFQTTFEERVTHQKGKDANAIFDALIPLGRHIPMTDIAYGMLYLAGPHSTNVTSTTFRIDGGMGG
ncbi:MAG: SDR family oxidoreductase [Actinobacteria bacterium]|uniref:Unannotated protein n=1 Tax=freshwater metagenome TaxID=449393 RepID=A0A6J7FI78_9ZZZZ|nr:SDR family oxidoreductase [Actinomycetota bacterium]